EQQRLADKRAEEQELRNAVLGSFLTEDPSVACSAFGPHRVITDRWKGMSPQQKKEIARIQQQQIEEKKRREETESRQNQAWEDQADRADRVGLLAQANEENRKRDRRDDLNAANSRLALDQREKQLTLEKLFDTNQPTEDYFNQFGVYPR
ncbi:unnamed protein product, partial [Meganyctiphanes norvegica]